MLAELASLEGEHETAAVEIGHALTELQRCEAWVVEWQAAATAMRVYTKLGRTQESEQCRVKSRHAADRVVATLLDEPELREIFNKRVAASLSMPE